MTAIIDTINFVEKAIDELRKQQEDKLPTLMLFGDDCQFMDASYIINAVKELKDELPDDCSVVAARIIADLTLLSTMTADRNSLIQERNDIVEEQIDDLVSSLDVQLSTTPEVKLTRAIKIGTKHLNTIQLSALSKVYDALKLTHVCHEERKDIVYHNYDETPNLSDDIISAFHEFLVKEDGATFIDGTLKFRNFVHSEDVQGYTSDLIKVIKSKRG